MGEFKKFGGYSGNRGGGDFKRGGDRPAFGGGRPAFGGPRSFGGKPSFNKFGDRGDRPMHKATCSECANTCEVPFRPTGEKPVFCNNCFGDKREGQSNSYTSTPRFEKKSFDRTERSFTPATNTIAARPDRRVDDLKLLVDSLHAKIDRMESAIKHTMNPVVASVPKEVSKPVAAVTPTKVSAPAKMVGKKEEKIVAKVAPKKVEVKAKAVVAPKKKVITKKK